MSTIRSSKFAGCKVWLGDGQVEFNAEGVCVGVVKRAGRALRPPEPVGPSQVQVALASASFSVSGLEGTTPEAAPEAAPELETPPEVPEEAPVEPQEAPAQQVGPEVASPPEGTTGAQEEAVVAPVEAEEPPQAGLGEMDKPALYRLAQDLGLSPDWIGSTKDGLIAQIVEAQERA